MSANDNRIIQHHPSRPTRLAALLLQADKAGAAGERDRACALIESIYASLDAGSQLRRTSAGPNLRYLSLSELQGLSLEDLLSPGCNESMDEN